MLPDPQAVLGCKFSRANPVGAETVGEYLVAIAEMKWEFDSPSQVANLYPREWKDEVYIALAESGVIDARFYSDGTLNWCDRKKAHALVTWALSTMY